ncbi:hypothetical protein QP635_00050 [Staphylococcus hominis]|uniref:Uncharacterized protein n=2 Tax=root TaxID=1 RepID=A0A8X8GTC3_STAHO|nr:hypothetical protein [Staphylococcus hominis]ASN67651.1 hypothetical protein 7F20_10 [uncultured Caudovirales phage]MCM5673314.1 hypothetical protein [Staphylococcus hominis]MDK7928276.1 hypothetical protein [Staphylococcus hominis]MDS3839242.1 hypothetical protein [Staphylococcus hominis]MDS3918689.1 hypothetical protein [Staphylococcus hominis]
MTEQERYLKEIATELKLIREQLEKSNNTIEIRSEIDTNSLQEFVNRENLKGSRTFNF